MITLLSTYLLNVVLKNAISPTEHYKFSEEHSTIVTIHT